MNDDLLKRFAKARRSLSKAREVYLEASKVYADTWAELESEARAQDELAVKMIAKEP